MKVAILAGGFGTRISEESQIVPKPLIKIGDFPILWHIMKSYSAYGYNEFVICLGYKGYKIKDYFLNYFLYRSDITVDFSNENHQTIHHHYAEPWKITLVETGLETMTGGRIKRIKEYIGDNTFMLTYGDGVSNININQLVQFHKEHGKIATVTAIQPAGRFGTLTLAKNEENLVESFHEKRRTDGGWINGGYFVLQPQIFDYIDGDHTVFENGPLEDIANAEELMAYKHTGFWHPMDTLHDKNKLEKWWASKKAPWKIWD